MTIAAITNYNVSLFLHVAAVVVGFGATFAESLMFPVAMKLDKRHLPYVHRLQLAINQWFASPALVVILLTGIYQMSEGNWDYGDVWVSASLAIVVVLAALNGAYFIPEDRKLGPMVERELAAGSDVTLSAEYQRRAQREGIVGAIAGLLVIAAIFLMVVKPGM